MVVGETTTELPVAAPGFHVYDVAPVADNVVELPAHMELDEAEGVTEGFGVTTRFSVLVLVHKPLDPVTV